MDILPVLFSRFASIYCRIIFDNNSPGGVVVSIPRQSGSLAWETLVRSQSLDFFFLPFRSYKLNCIRARRIEIQDFACVSMVIAFEQTQSVYREMSKGWDRTNVSHDSTPDCRGWPTLKEAPPE